MPIEHRVDPETGFLLVRRWGLIDTYDEEAAFEERSKDSQVVQGLPVLIDCRDVDPPDSKQVIQYLANRGSRIAAELDCGPIAIIAGSDAEYGMARMYIALAEMNHPNTMVFRNYDEGLKWLFQQTNNVH